jgi:Fur family transcriptional regulator, peroxide stress response regulator
MLQSHLKKEPFRKTKQRTVILEELQKVDTHPSADEIYMMVRKRMPRISLGTVYRNLELLSEKGIILKLTFGGNQKRFDGYTEQHYHIRCMQCGKIADAPIDPITTIDEKADKLSGYKIFGHNLEFIGLCPDCA